MKNVLCMKNVYEIYQTKRCLWQWKYKFAFDLSYRVWQFVSAIIFSGVAIMVSVKNIPAKTGVGGGSNKEITGWGIINTQRLQPPSVFSALYSWAKVQLFRTTREKGGWLGTSWSRASAVRQKLIPASTPFWIVSFKVAIILKISVRRFVCCLSVLKIVKAN